MISDHGPSNPFSSSSSGGVTPGGTSGGTASERLRQLLNSNAGPQPRRSSNDGSSSSSSGNPRIRELLSQHDTVSIKKSDQIGGGGGNLKRTRSGPDRVDPAKVPSTSSSGAATRPYNFILFTSFPGKKFADLPAGKLLHNSPKPTQTSAKQSLALSLDWAHCIKIQDDTNITPHNQGCPFTFLL